MQPSFPISAGLVQALVASNLEQMSLMPVHAPIHPTPNCQTHFPKEKFQSITLLG